MSSSAETILRKEKTMKFERSEIGALFSKLRTAVPEVRAVGNDSTGILLSGPDAFATNLELSIRTELSSPVPQGVVIPPRGVDFISGAVAPEININVTKSGLVIESGTARARLSTTPAENYPTFDGPGKDAKRCVVSANDLSWAVSKVLYAVSKDDRHPAHKGLCFPTAATILWKSALWMGTEWPSVESTAPLMVISSLCFRRQRQRQLIRWVLMGASILKETAKRPFSATINMK